MFFFSFIFRSFGSNLLTELPSSAFSPLSSLQSLNISNNLFTTIPAAINLVPSLQQVYLRANNISILSSMSITAINVLSVDVANNPIAKVYSDWSHSAVTMKCGDDLNCNASSCFGMFQDFTHFVFISLSECLSFSVRDFLFLPVTLFLPDIFSPLMIPAIRLLIFFSFL